MRKKKTIAEFSAIIGELAASVNQTYYCVAVALDVQSGKTTMKYTSYIHGFNHIHSNTMNECILEMKKQIGLVVTVADNIVCE